MSAQDLEQRARELLAAEYERDGKTGSAEHIRTQPLLPNKARAVRAIAAALRHQPAPVVDDARMARALEAARRGLAPEHVSAIEEAIAAYDPNCGARTVRVVDDAMRELIDADKEYDAIRQRAQRYPCPGMDEHVMAVRKRRAAALARAQGVQS